jgi:hypothetical protein
MTWHGKHGRGMGKGGHMPLPLSRLRAYGKTREDLRPIVSLASASIRIYYVITPIYASSVRSLSSVQRRS